MKLSWAIRCLLLVASVQSVLIELVKSGPLLKARVVFGNQAVKFLPVCLYTPTIILTDLDNNQRPQISLHNSSFQYINGAGITLPKEGFSRIMNTSLSSIDIDNVSIGYGLQTQMNVTISNVIFNNVEVHAVVQQLHKVSDIEEESLNLMSLFTSLQASSALPVYSAILRPPYTIEFSYSKQSQRTSLGSSSEQKIQGIYVDNQQVMADAPQTYYTLISKDRVTSSKQTIMKLVEKISPDSDCWVLDSQILCGWSSAYRPVDIKIGDGVYRFEDGEYVDKCYYSVRYWRNICELKLSICPHGHTYLGWPFLSVHPIQIFSNSSQRFLSNNTSNSRQNARLGYFVSIVENNLGLLKIHRWMLAAFGSLLIILKGYHIYFKSLPRSSYSDFDSIIMDNNNNSERSTQSEGEDSDKDRFSEMANG